MRTESIHLDVDYHSGNTEEIFDSAYQMLIQFAMNDKEEKELVSKFFSKN